MIQVAEDEPGHASKVTGVGSHGSKLYAFENEVDQDFLVHLGVIYM